MRLVNVGGLGIKVRRRNRQWWPDDGRAMEFDGSNNRAMKDGAGVSPAALLACTRASSGRASRASGRLAEFTANELRITDRGLLVEEARTNYLHRSQEFDNGSWVKVIGPTISANAATAPDGTMSADKLVCGSANSYYRVQQSATLSGEATLSVYAKAAGHSHILVFISDAGFIGGTYFDLVNGVIDGHQASAPAASRIEDAGNGWYRCSMTTTVTNPTSARIFTNDGARYAYHGDGVSGTYIWGAQLEPGPAATSYIETAGASAVREADQVQFSDLSWLNAAQGTFVIDVLTEATNTDPRFFESGSGDLAAYRAGLSDTVVTKLCTGPTTQNATLGSGLLSGGARAAVGWDATGSSIVANAGTVVSNASTPSAMANLRLGNRTALDRALNGRVRSIIYWPTRKTDVELQGLTA